MFTDEKLQRIQRTLDSIQSLPSKSKIGDMQSNFSVVRQNFDLKKEKMEGVVKNLKLQLESEVEALKELRDESFRKKKQFRNQVDRVKSALELNIKQRTSSVEGKIKTLGLELEERLGKMKGMLENDKEYLEKEVFQFSRSSREDLVSIQNEQLKLIEETEGEYAFLQRNFSEKVKEVKELEAELIEANKGEEDGLTREFGRIHDESQAELKKTKEERSKFEETVLTFVSESIEKLEEE